MADRAGSLVVDVFKTQQMKIFSEPEVRLKKFAPDDVREFGIRTVCAIPIIVEGNSYAALVLHHFVEREYSAEDRQLAEAFGDLASIAVENACLHEEAQRSRKFLESVVIDSADAFIIVDPDQKIISWNSGAEILYGYAKEEVLGQHVNMVIPEKDREETSRFNKKMMTEEIPVTFEVERVRKDGRFIPVILTLSPVNHEEGTLIVNAGIHRNFTERKRVEGELRRTNEEAESANRAKSEFLSNMSHELRSPLNGVVGFSDIILLQSEDEKTLHLAEKIKDSGLYLTRMIEKILDLDRIDAGKVRLDMEDIAMNDLVSDVASAWYPSLPKNISLWCDFDFGIDVVRCDPTRVKQILTILLDNAVKYSSRGGLITVRTQKNTNDIWVSVKDEGMTYSLRSI